MATLTIHRGQTLDREIELNGRDIRIGRGSTNDPVAELRCDHGRYVLVDFDSPGGLWVHGQRQRMVTLEPGTPVNLGSYTLALVDAAGMPDAPPRQAGQPRSIEKPTRKGPDGPATSTARSAGLVAVLARLPRLVLFGGFAGFVLVVIALGQIVAPSTKASSAASAFTNGAPKPSSPSNQDVKRQYLGTAQFLFEGRRYDEAIAALDRALLATPSDSEVVEFRARVVEQRAATTDESGPARPNAPTDKPDSAKGRIDARSARDLKSSVGTRAPEGTQPTGLRRIGEIPTVRTVDGQNAPVNVAIRPVGQQILELATQLENDGDLPGALQHYLDAQGADPSLSVIVAASTTRIRARMNREGSEAYRAAKQYDAEDRMPEASALYQKAYGYLSEDDPNRGKAKAALDRIRQ